ncbi:MAG: acyltransferase [Cyanobacteria bacterium J06626_18]
MMSSKPITPITKVPLTEQLNAADASLLQRYQDKVLGETDVLQLARYELANLLLGNLPGALGYLLRKKVYPGLLKQVGRGVIWGQGLVLRHPGKMTLGDRVAIDDNTLLDASGTGPTGMTFGDDVIISRNCVIQGKTGPLVLGNKVDIGCNVILSSGNGIFIGNSVLIAGNCYIGGGRYVSDRTDIPMMEQGVYSKGPVAIGDDVWLGAGATVLDGVKLGRGCIVGAGAVVTKSFPDFSVVAGVPAKLLRNRKMGD